jgi:hypothetical protein
VTWWLRSVPAATTATATPTTHATTTSTTTATGTITALPAVGGHGLLYRGRCAGGQKESGGNQDHQEAHGTISDREFSQLFSCAVERAQNALGRLGPIQIYMNSGHDQAAISPAPRFR